MSKIKEQDILKLLRGEASAKKLKALELWSSESTDNARDLEQYQLIYDESEHLSSYKKVDADAEWALFQESLSQSVSDGELLQYFDGVASPSQKKKVEEWKSFSDANQKDFDVFDIIVNESSKLSNYKQVSVDDEWKAFNKAIKGKATPPNLTAVGMAPVVNEVVTPITPPQISTSTPSLNYTPPPSPPSTASTAKEVTFVPSPTYEVERSNNKFLWRSLAVAASLLLLTAFGWSIWRSANTSGLSDADLYATFATADTPDQITISDGSILYLDEETTVTYFRDVNLIDERSVILEGKGEFDIASMPDKPFTVRAKRSGVGVQVLGTRFRFEDSEGYLEVIENIEGSVRAYSLSDTTTFVVMTAGDKYGFDGVNFVDLNVEEYNGQNYDILYVLDFLMKESDWKVTSGPEIEFDAKAIVNIDLNQPYLEILEDLRERANFEYIPKGCDGCYVVTRFAAPTN